MENLLCHEDGHVWISDDRISAQLSHRSAGVEQIDFHGVQPVSRNAKLLQHDAGVLRFYLEGTIAGTRQTLASTWQNIRVGPATIAQSWILDSLPFELQVTVAHDALLVRCCCSAPAKTIDELNPRFRIIWEAASQTTAVHGQRTWAAIRKEEHGLVLRANDRILLREWLRRSGDYQGDFLIPESWRRLIFSRRCVSGTARFEDVRPEYRDSDLLLYDADTWIRAGGTGYDIHCKIDSAYEFSTSFAEEANSLCTPVFSIRFFTQEPSEPADSEAYACRSLFVQQEQRYEHRRAEVPALELAEHPGLCDFFQHVPLIVESARLQDFGMTRACPGTYYWMWGWDNLVTTCAQLRWGDVHPARRVVDFVRTHRDLDGSIPGRWSRHLEPMDSRGFGAMDFLFSELVLQLYGETLDRQIIRANYPTVYSSFSTLLEKSQDSGFFPTIGMYPDLPHKMGRDESYYVAIDSGAWYALCRNIAHMAWMMQDQATARKAEQAADRVEGHYLATFWDQEAGFICDSVHPSSGGRNRTFPIFSLLCMESPFGHLLLGERMLASGRFLSEHILQPRGIAMTPTWDRYHNSEPAMSAWYPHWDLPAVKVWLRCGDGQAIQRWLELVERTYNRMGYCPEFLSLHAPENERWLHHGAAWNLNCATGWYSAILHALLGLQFDPGGITLLPIPAVYDKAGRRNHARVRKLNFRGGLWDVATEGEGDHIIDLRVDGESIIGSHKIPVSCYTPAEHHVSIRYGKQPCGGPALAEFCGGHLLSVQTSAGKTSATVRGFGRVDFSVCAAQRPYIQLDGKPVAFSWNAGQRKGHGRISLAGEHELVLVESRT